MRTAIITGASSGLGLECARALLRSDPSMHVVLAVRDTGLGNMPDKIDKNHFAQD